MVTNETVSHEALRLLANAESIVREVPDIEGLRCHELARVVGTVLGLPVQDGHYDCIDHSWLVVHSVGQLHPLVLDVYCVGRLPMVQLIDTHLLLPHLYRACKRRRDIRKQQIKDILEALRDQGFDGA